MFYEIIFSHCLCRGSEKKILGSKYLLLKYDISAQNKGKHVSATSLFQNFVGEHAPRPPERNYACGVTNNGCAVADLTLCQEINLRALEFSQSYEPLTVRFEAFLILFLALSLTFTDTN